MFSPSIQPSITLLSSLVEAGFANFPQAEDPPYRLVARRVRKMMCSPNIFSRFLVSHKALELTSPTLRAMFRRGFRKGLLHFDNIDPPAIALPEDDPALFGAGAIVTCSRFQVRSCSEIGKVQSGKQRWCSKSHMSLTMWSSSLLRRESSHSRLPSARSR
jgi:hypothetical protein